MKTISSFFIHWVLFFLITAESKFAVIGLVFATNRKTCRFLCLWLLAFHRLLVLFRKVFKIHVWTALFYRFVSLLINFYRWKLSHILENFSDFGKILHFWVKLRKQQEVLVHAKINYCNVVEIPWTFTEFLSFLEFGIKLFSPISLSLYGFFLSSQFIFLKSAFQSQRTHDNTLEGNWRVDDNFLFLCSSLSKINLYRTSRADCIFRQYIRQLRDCWLQQSFHISWKVFFDTTNLWLRFLCKCPIKQDWRIYFRTQLRYINKGVELLAWCLWMGMIQRRFYRSFLKVA